MTEGFPFQQLLSEIQIEIMVKMDDLSLVKYCRASNERMMFCNDEKLDWFWKKRLEIQFNNDKLDQNTLNKMKMRKKSWSQVYIVLLQLRRLKSALNLKGTLTDIYNLQYLDLNNNNQLPAEIENLDNLQTLNIQHAKLNRLPSEIGNLRNLETLSIKYTKLTYLPAEIGNLDKLIHLYLNDNQLTRLPAEIGNLTNLKDLSLNNNQLTYLPAEIGNLDKLKHLRLNRNKLTQLPTEIGNLTSLSHLGLNGNKLTQLPAEIKNLTNLDILEIRNNPYNI